MKALLIKDLELIRVQKHFFLSMIVIAATMLFMGNDPTFPIGYFIMLSILFTLSTISYDEFDNGNSFLFSLPITRKQYVLEKYLLGFLLGIGSSVFGIGFSMLAARFRKLDLLPDILSCAGVCLLAAMLLLAIQLPLHFKFGGEKARMALMAVIGTFFVIGFLLAKASFGANFDFSSILSRISQLSLMTWISIITLCDLLICFCSYRISLAILLTKDF